MSGLNRLQVGQFTIHDAITLQELKNDMENMNSHLITIEQLFQKSNHLYLQDRELKLFLNGVQLKKKQPDGIYKIYHKDDFIGIGCIQNNLLKRDIII